MSFVKYWRWIVREYEQLPTCIFLLSLQFCQASVSLNFKFLPHYKNYDKGFLEGNQAVKCIKFLKVYTLNFTSGQYSTWNFFFFLRYMQRFRYRYTDSIIIEKIANMIVVIHPYSGEWCMQRIMTALKDYWYVELKWVRIYHDNSSLD